METQTLNFTYSGEFIADLARTGYWFENRREWAIRVLKCLRMPIELNEDQMFYLQSRGLSQEQIWAMIEHKPLTDEQVSAVLNGTAILTEDSKFIRETDTEFQKVIFKRKEGFVEIGNYMVSRKVLDPYLMNVKQHGQSSKSGKYSYEDVLKSVGFIKYVSDPHRSDLDPRKEPKIQIINSPDSLGFQAALLKYAQLYLEAKP